ncbi:MAG: carboxypeptidase-like regulatory domain-containing protein [Saprospiraceae bacterium]|nr:carboxypeptidase-like regulatory domain-containing protein [Saprospiraceae bacterium]
MDFKFLNRQHFISLAFLFLSFGVFAQKMTTVKGKIVDAGTKEPIPFATIAFMNLTPPVGTTSEMDGSFLLEYQWASPTQIEVASVGYETQVLQVVPGTKQTLDIQLKSSTFQLNEVVVKEKKRRYKRDPENPAIILMRAVIENKEKNRIEASSFYEVDKYEKVQFDLNNFDPEKLRNRKAMKPFRIVLDHVDTSALNGKPYLPFFIQESSSKVYYRKDPADRKEHREGMKVTGMKEYVDDKDLNDMLQVLYQSVNIYQNDIKLLDLSFMSPLSTSAIGYYRFYIIDSTGNLRVNGIPVTKVSFLPENDQNIAFKGDLWITRDSTFAVVKADFGISKNINVNFVQKLSLQQEFAKQPNGVWARTKDLVAVDFSVLKKGTGMYGTRTAMYRDFVFDKPMPDDYYAGTQKVIEDPNLYKRDEAFWEGARHVTLTKKEAGVYQMIDTLQKLPSFKRTMTTLGLLTTGYKAFGPVDIGPIANFYSFNPVEGNRVKLGGETNLKFNKKISFGGYGAYGFKDQEFKYAAYGVYSFREDFKQNPKHYIRAFVQKDVNLVGQILVLNSPDNFFLSFQRGTRDRMLMNNKAQLEYNVETKSHVTYNITYTNNRIRPIGSTLLSYTDPELGPSTLKEFTTSEAALTLRFAPNEQYIQGRTYRSQLYNKHPIFTLRLVAGMKDVLGGDYAYQSASLNIVKRFYLSFLGVTRMDFEAGKVWGDGIPNFLLNMPKANQSYFYRTNSFNLMNYQEFVSDEYALILLEHNFNGWILNKIPLLRKLKLRESVTFKAIYGQLSDRNDPDKNPEYIQFQSDENGNRVNYTLEGKPYIETGFGIGNILRVLRVDAVWRLKHPTDKLHSGDEIPSMFGKQGFSLLFRFKLEF